MKWKNFLTLPISSMWAAIIVTIVAGCGGGGGGGGGNTPAPNPPNNPPPPTQVTWTRVTPSGPVQDVRAIVIDPQTPTTVYATTFESLTNTDAIQKSVNGGSTWTVLRSTTGNTTPDGQAIAVNPKTPKYLYYGTERSGTYKSDDFGATWTQVISASTKTYSLAIDNVDPTKVYAGHRADTLSRTTNGGSSNGWTQWSVAGLQSNAGIMALAVNPQNPAIVWAGLDAGALNVGSGRTGGGVYKSLDYGQTWFRKTTSIASATGTINTVAIDPVTPDTVYVGGQGIMKSVNGGQTFTMASTGLPSGQVVYALAIDPRAPTTIYAGMYLGGVARSTDGGATWSEVNTGLASLNVNTLAINPSNGVVYAGTADGIFKTQ